MLILRGHFEDRRVVVDDPVPPEVVSGTPVRVIFDSFDGEHDASMPGGNGDVQDAEEGNVFDRIIALGKELDLDLPTDFSVNHKHYTKGVPK